MSSKQILSLKTHRNGLDESVGCVEVSPAVTFQLCPSCIVAFQQVVRVCNRNDRSFEQKLRPLQTGPLISQEDVHSALGWASQWRGLKHGHKGQESARDTWVTRPLVSVDAALHHLITSWAVPVFDWQTGNNFVQGFLGGGLQAVFANATGQMERQRQISPLVCMFVVAFACCLRTTATQWRWQQQRHENLLSCSSTACQETLCFTFQSLLCFSLHSFSQEETQRRLSTYILDRPWSQLVALSSRPYHRWFLLECRTRESAAHKLSPWKRPWRRSQWLRLHTACLQPDTERKQLVSVYLLKSCKCFATLVQFLPQQFRSRLWLLRSSSWRKVFFFPIKKRETGRPVWLPGCPWHRYRSHTRSARTVLFSDFPSDSRCRVGP